jgi:hypothetical protein
MSLKYLFATGVGPIDPLHVEFGERVNLITGDNGLGKSLILDLAFWQLTNSWPGRDPLLATEIAQVASTIDGVSADEIDRSTHFYPDRQRWIWKSGGQPKSGLVIYARANGGFSVWDPARNYYRDSLDPELGEAPRAFLMTQADVWNGLAGERDGTSLCNGLIRDWVSWQRERRTEFDVLCKVLAALSPEGDSLEPAEPARLSPDDVRDFPMLRTAYGEIPATQASEAVRRILGLAYLIAWTWTEHQRAARLRGFSASNRLVVLVDEIEAHLHPRWQRTILPSLLEAIGQLNAEARVQLIGVTHAPLLLASMEPLFDDERDRLFVIDLDRSNGRAHAKIGRQDFRRRGDATAWLTSDVFDLPEAMSIPAEEIRKAASALMAPEAAPSAADYAQVDERLRSLLAPEDVFLLRWRHFGESRGLVSQR